ncbi:shikimate 5-dehydrogenase [Pseudomonas sp. S75]|uniref:shikimate 5-dehydrogenase n=1 Tax=unclassified Pseudomonas TaxID=196821 RepID=UPI001902E201|nr:MULTISPECIES: shikimate 5-dehydrogenase [unclassified Pseudomonas]MBJ9973948.1 shikimate 5-dehydrogenase [Pseudomonas sp. S30]MBK0152122.1 shikimate 5-dehydrogenase [Pseudomonas sp. S75]
MAIAPGRDTTLCISLAGRPGTFGVRFHNHLYRQLGLDYYYKAMTTDDLPAAVAGIRALGIRGCGVSMPFKEACLALVDEVDASAAAIQSVNTLVNTRGHLKAYNTDYMAVRQLLEAHSLDPDTAFALRGSGGMAKAVASALRDAGFAQGLIIARNEQAGRQLADVCGYRWQAELGDLCPPMLINVTPIGMAGGPQAQALAFPREAVAVAQQVFDVVALPVRTPLVCLAEELGKPVITGLDVIALQALEQFVLYTGVRPTAAQIEAAVTYAREA